MCAKKRNVKPNPVETTRIAFPDFLVKHNMTKLMGATLQNLQGWIEIAIYNKILEQLHFLFGSQVECV